MENNIDKIKQKILDIINPDIDYSQSDFDKEFDNLNTSDETTYKTTIKFVNNSTNESVKYEKDGDSGFDLRANLTESITIPKGQTRLIPTGLHLDLNRGLEAQIRSRSGLSNKHNVFVLNSPGTIDYQYVDEIKVILTNLGNDDFTVINGMKIARVVICPVLSEHFVNLVKVDKFDGNKHRGGFGHTGLI